MFRNLRNTGAAPRARNPAVYGRVPVCRGRPGLVRIRDHTGATQQPAADRAALTTVVNRVPVSIGSVSSRPAAEPDYSGSRWCLRG